MSGLLIAAPLRLEAWAISAGRPPARIVRTGMGASRARAAARRLHEDPAAALLVMGLGGGLDPASRVGEVVVAEHVREPGGEPIACHGADTLAHALARAGLPVRRGPVVSVARIAVGETRAALGAAGALAVDMESAWLAAAARRRPFAVVRVLSDTPSQELLHPRAVVGVARACSALRRMAGALHEWAPGE